MPGLCQGGSQQTVFERVMLGDGDFRIRFWWVCAIIFALDLEAIIDCHIAEPASEQCTAAIRIGATDGGW